MTDSQDDIKKIYIVVGLGCLLLTGSMYFFGLKPLSDRLRIEHFHEIPHVLESGHSLLQAVFDKHISLARQSASRTAIRKKQIAFLDGKVSHKEFVAFSAPKLADAMYANKEIVGIQRFGPDGKLLFSVGQSVPEQMVIGCELQKRHKMRVLGPVRVNRVNRLIYCSPIIDRDAGYVGADVLIMDDAAIQDIIDENETLGNYGIVKKDQIIYWPSKLKNSSARAAFEACLKSACKNHSGDHQDYSQQGFIFNSRPIEETGWQLYSIVNKKDFFHSINRRWIILLGVVFLVSVFIFILTVLALRPVINTLLREKKLLELTHHDGLTGMYNHAYMQELLDVEIERAIRHGHLLSLLMFDIDYFKKVNDVFGHQAGDIVLKKIAEVVSKTIRTNDLAARYGGEEFLLIFPETGSEGSIQLAERLRKNIEKMKLVIPGTGEIRVTISIGVVSCDACYDHYTKQHIITVADEALYLSKGEGRNRITAITLEGEGRNRLTTVTMN